MKLEELKTIEQLSQFLDGTQAVIFKLDTDKKKRYQWIQHELVGFDYMRIGKADKGILKRYLAKVSSYSRAQAIKKLMERAYGVFGEQEYKRLSAIFVSHLYNLRQSKTYSKTRTHFEKTRPKKPTIGERKKPQPTKVCVPS